MDDGPWSSERPDRLAAWVVVTFVVGFLLGVVATLGLAYLALEWAVSWE